MSETEIKTRLGLILQGVLAAAMREAGIAFVQNQQYDETCEVPDFLVPNAEAPCAMIEVHQTQALNSFQMKTLRTVTAVFEAKARFGPRLCSVNVLFGDPDTELLSSNVKAMCGLFDLNILLRRDSGPKSAVKALEQDALKLASDPKWATDRAVAELVATSTSKLRVLGAAIADLLKAATPRNRLLPLWRKERTRVGALRRPPHPGQPTYYRRSMLSSLFLSDAAFASLCASRDANECDAATRKQLVATGLAELAEEIDGDRITLVPTFSAFLNDGRACQLRAACQGVLGGVPEMHWYFEDIRDGTRRLRMAEHFLHQIRERCRLSAEILANLGNDNYGGVPHRRCWMADLAARYLGVSHNRMNSALRDLGADSLRLGNPFRQVTYRSSRLMARPEVHQSYTDAIGRAFWQILATSEARPATSAQKLADRLLELRLDGVVKLQKLDPLLLVVRSIAGGLGLLVEDCAVPSLISDLAGERAVGRFEMFVVRRDGSATSALLNAVSAHDNNGDHKSKEWGARRLATLYRTTDDGVRESEYQEAVFVLDGEWTGKDVTRLHRSGWNRVIRLGDLEATLRTIFRIRGTVARHAQKTVGLIECENHDEPTAAEAS